MNSNLLTHYNEIMCLVVSHVCLVRYTGLTVKQFHEFNNLYRYPLTPQHSMLASVSKFSFKAVSEYESERNLYLCSSSARSCCWPVLHTLENLVHSLGAANSHNKKKALWEQISPSLCVVVLGWS